MSQITHFCGVKLEARKSGCVKFWTNIMSGGKEDGGGKRCQRRRMIWWAAEKAGELGKNARKLSDGTIFIELNVQGVFLLVRPKK